MRHGERQIGTLGRWQKRINGTCLAQRLAKSVEKNSKFWLRLTPCVGPTRTTGNADGFGAIGCNTGRFRNSERSTDGPLGAAAAPSARRPFPTELADIR